MKIGVLYIATGKYACFWPAFYESSEKFLFKDDEKHYFVFTDSPDIKGDNVTVFHRECQGFPNDTLFRFDMFLSQRDYLENMDYLYFFNSNVVFKDYVDRELIPEAEHNYLLGVLSPMESVRHYPPLLFRYERNKKSLAYIPPYKFKKYHYYLGGLNGGRTPEFLQLCNVLAQNIRTDYDNGIIAFLHDESHINCYFHLHPPLILGREYGVFESWNVKFSHKLMFRDKLKVDSYFQKNKDSNIAKILRFSRRVLSGLKWYAGL